MPFDPNAISPQSSNIYGLDSTAESSQIIILPVPYDATTSYKQGTAEGPEAIRRASKQVELFDPVLGNPYTCGIFMTDPLSHVYDLNSKARLHADPVLKAGGINNDITLQPLANKVNEISARVNDIVYKETQIHLLQGKTPCIVGGDHSVSFGAIKAYSEKYPTLGILHIDAHADLRKSFEGFEWSHASIMYNVLEKIPEVSTVVQLGVRDICQQEVQYIEQSSRVHVVLDDYFHTAKILPTTDLTVENLLQSAINALPEHVYISFDIDGLDPSLCPNTGTPVPGGFSFSDIKIVLQFLSQNKTIVGFDLVEVGSHEWDASVGARLLYQLAGYMLNSQKRYGKRV